MRGKGKDASKLLATLSALDSKGLRGSDWPQSPTGAVNSSPVVKACGQIAKYQTPIAPTAACPLLALRESGAIYRVAVQSKARTDGDASTANTPPSVQRSGTGGALEVFPWSALRDGQAGQAQGFPCGSAHPDSVGRGGARRSNTCRFKCGRGEGQADGSRRSADTHRSIATARAFWCTISRSEQETRVEQPRLPAGRLHKARTATNLNRLAPERLWNGKSPPVTLETQF